MVLTVCATCPQGLQHKDLAKLKRTIARSSSLVKAASNKAPAQPAQTNEPIIARLSAGMALDFSKLGEPSLYLVATDDGRVHQVHLASVHACFSRVEC